MSEEYYNNYKLHKFYLTIKYPTKQYYNRIQDFFFPFISLNTLYKKNIRDLFCLI